MKILVLLFISIIGFASTNTKLDKLSLQEIETQVYTMLSNHDELTTEQRISLEKNLNNHFRKLELLKIKESHLHRQLFSTFFVEEQKQQSESKIRKSLSQVYDEKEELIFTTVKSIQASLGTSKSNKLIMQDILWLVGGR